MRRKKSRNKRTSSSISLQMSQLPYYRNYALTNVSYVHRRSCFGETRGIKTTLCIRGTQRHKHRNRY
jgi:hypothetical protein